MERVLGEFFLLAVGPIRGLLLGQQYRDLIPVSDAVVVVAGARIRGPRVVVV